MTLVKAAAGYHYSAEGHHYILDPEMMIGVNRLHLTGCGIYNMDLEYLGYWDRFNMPIELVNGLTKWYKRERAEEITKRRTAMMRKTRRPKI